MFKHEVTKKYQREHDPDHLSDGHTLHSVHIKRTARFVSSAYITLGHVPLFERRPTQIPSISPRVGCVLTVPAAGSYGKTYAKEKWKQQNGISRTLNPVAISMSSPVLHSCSPISEEQRAKVDHTS